MDDTKREWVRSWLIKAHSDLRSARALVALAEPATDTAIYCSETVTLRNRVPKSCSPGSVGEPARKLPALPGQHPRRNLPPREFPPERSG